MFFFFFNDTATTEIYTLSLHDALPIFKWSSTTACAVGWLAAEGSSLHRRRPLEQRCSQRPPCASRSEEHTSELQSRQYLVCRLLLEKKKKDNPTSLYTYCTAVPQPRPK